MINNTAYKLCRVCLQSGRLFDRILGTNNKLNIRISGSYKYRMYHKGEREAKYKLYNMMTLQLDENGKMASSLMNHQFPLFLDDVKNFFISSNGYPGKLGRRRWYILRNLRKITSNSLIVVEGISSNIFEKKLHFERSNEFFADCSSKHKYYFRKLFYKCKACIKFENRVAVTDFADTFYNSNISDFILTDKQENAESKETWKLYPKGKLRPDLKELLNNKDNFDRRQLLMNEDLLESTGMLPSKNNDLQFSKSQYKKVTSNSPIFALDCEMVITKGESMKHNNDLAKISVVDEDLNLVYCTMVKPNNPIVNYVTWVNGLTEGDFLGITTNLKDVQTDLNQLLPDDAILLGHSLINDMLALKLSHPYCMDTSYLFNVSGTRTATMKLKHAARIFIKTLIQDGTIHDPTEDAKVTMLLAKLKLSKEIGYGDTVNGWEADNSKKAEEIGNAVNTENIFKVLSKQPNTPNVIYSSGLDENMFNKIRDFTTVLKESSYPHVINKAMELINEKQNVVAHLKIEANDESDIRKLDEFIYNYYADLPYSSLLTVIVPIISPENEVTSGYVYIFVKN